MAIMPPAPVLVTGASGYLAGFVVDRLKASGYYLSGFDKIPPPPGRPLDNFVVGDITKYGDVCRAVTGQHAVIHLAGLVRGRWEQPLERFADVMVKGTWFLFDASSELGVTRVVNVSSVVALGPPPANDELFDEKRPAAQGGSDLNYQLSKWLGEEIGRVYGAAHNMSVINLRPGVIAGDGHNPGPSLPPTHRRRWFVYVDPRDVAQAVEGALRASAPRQDSYFIVAAHPEASYDIGAARRDLDYDPEHNWPELRVDGSSREE